MSRLPNVVSSTRHDRPRTISRRFSKRPIQITHTMSSTMMRNFMTSRAFSKGGKPGGGEDLGKKDASLIPGQAEVMTIFD
jgi:hypothetical protein